MSRWVVPKRAGLRSESRAGEQPDGPLGRIVKYVPAEIVTAYTLLFTALVTLELPEEQTPSVAAFLILLFLFATMAYVWTRTAGVVRKSHLVVSPLAFLAWSYPISSAALGEYFVPLWAFVGQAVVVALALFVAPREG